MPGQHIADHSGHRRPDQRGQHPGRGHQPEHRGLRPLRVDHRDQHEHGHGQTAGRRALQHPADQQLRHRPGGARHQQARSEQQRRADQRRPGATGVAPPAAEHGAEHRGGQERDERPGVERHRAQVGHHRGHRGADAHALERDQGDQQHDADRHRALARPEQLSPDAVGGARGWGGVGLGGGYGRHPFRLPARPGFRSSEMSAGPRAFGPTVSPRTGSSRGAGPAGTRSAGRSGCRDPAAPARRPRSAGPARPAG